MLSDTSIIALVFSKYPVVCNKRLYQHKRIFYLYIYISGMQTDNSIFTPSCPRDISAAQAPAIKPPGLLPATVGDTYNPPDHSVTAARTQTKQRRIFKSWVFKPWLLVGKNKIFKLGYAWINIIRWSRTSSQAISENWKNGEKGCRDLWDQATAF